MVKRSTVVVNFYPFSTLILIVFVCAVLIPSINAQSPDAETEQEGREKKAGARPFIGPNDKRGGGRALQFVGIPSLKRAGGRGFVNANPSEFDKRGGGRGFQFNDVDFDKRGGGRGFVSQSDAEKRGGGHRFMPFSDKRFDDFEMERRAGGRAFAMPFYGLDKRGGARPFHALVDWKRAGERGFSNFYQGGTMKRGGGRAFQGNLKKRGGGRGFQVDSDDMDKRGGGRSFFGGGSLRSFYGGSGGPSLPFYEKKAVEYVPYYMDASLKRGGARAFNAPSSWRLGKWYAEKRAGGRTFPIEDMDDSKEKRMIDELTRQMDPILYVK